MTVAQQPLAPFDQHQIVVAASEVLANSSVGDLRCLRVDQHADNLQLSGQVRSFYHKQLAQETIRTVAGNMRVDNRVSVRGAGRPR